MIRRLLVHKSPAFSDIELYVEKGFNVFSGASGSGKSVFMESLLAIFGIKESNADLIEANIELDSINIDLDSYSIPNDDDEIVLSILKKDKTRYFINHTSSSKKKLNELVSGFAKHISIKGADDLKPNAILGVFDRFISINDKAFSKIKDDFSLAFSEFSDVAKELESITAQETNMANLKEFAAFEIAKIEGLKPKEGEYEHLLELKKTLSRQEKIREQMELVRSVLDKTHCFDSFLNLVDCECVALNEGLSELESILQKQEEQLNDLQEINAEDLLNRISSLSELIRRFGSISKALEYLQEQKENLSKYENVSIDKQKLQDKYTKLDSACKNLASELHSKRVAFAKSFESKLKELCLELRLNEPKFSINSLDSLNSLGNSQIELNLSGSSIEVLSSGEYNRLRLAMMCLDIDKSSGGILVLDEIDANLSGEESAGVAKILKTLSSKYQIFAISHQTHMPSIADTHYLVQKCENTSQIVKLDYQGRVSEIARIISGSEITPQALDFAKSYLAQNGIVG